MSWRDWLPRPVKHLAAPRDVQEVVSRVMPLPSESVIIRPGEYATPIPQRDLPNPVPPVDTMLYGATGTPITSGFVTELGEYNSEMRGRNALAVYEKMRRSDADVAAILYACKLPIRSAEFRIHPGVEENEPEYEFAKEIADFIKDNLFGGLEYENQLGMRFSQRFDSVIENALLCLDFGCSGYEDIWVVDQDKVRLRRMAPRLPLTFYRFHAEPDGETLRSIEQWGYRGSDFVTVAVPGNKFTLFSYRMEGSNFYGRSILREAYQHWYIKNALYRIDSVACERNGAGVPVITMGQNPTLEDRNIAYQWATNLTAHESTSLVLPFGFDFKLAATSGTEHNVMSSVHHHSEMITRSVLAMFLALGTTQSGSRALGNAMIDFFQLSEEAIAKFICDTISETTIRRMVDFNFNRNGKPIPYPRLVAPSVVVLNPVDVFSTLTSLASSSVDLLQPDDETENWIRKKMGMPLKAKETRPRSAPIPPPGSDPGTVPTDGLEIPPTKPEDDQDDPLKKVRTINAPGVGKIKPSDNATPGAKARDPEVEEEKKEKERAKVTKAMATELLINGIRIAASHCGNCGAQLLGGPGSGCSGPNCGRPRGSESKDDDKEEDTKSEQEPSASDTDSDGKDIARAARAKAAYVPATKEMQIIADNWQHKVAKILQGEVTPDNAPPDVLVHKYKAALEVKTIQKSKVSRVPMRKDSRRRKEAYARKHGMKSHTVAIDLRGPKPVYYYKAGVGGFRFGSMEKLDSMAQVKARISGVR